MKITPLASGSAGNSFLVSNSAAAILVDAGLSGKQIRERMTAVGVEPASLSAIVVSHGHVDHVKGVGVLSRKFKLPVWMNERTWTAAKASTGEVHRLEVFETGKTFQIESLRIHPFSVPHDCADPVGFRISSGKGTVGIATDLGAATGLVTNLLSDVRVLVLESNHDPRMLRDGPYPWELKQRIRGRLGHLSNEDSAKLLARIVSDRLEAVVLAHVSDTNNLPELALQSARGPLGEFLRNRGRLLVASQDEVGPTIECA
jgi:phosphoribosyl 1,2-cyclic phosphodiesterase